MSKFSKDPGTSPDGVLIVEDHPGLREELENWLLDEFPDVDVFGAHSGAEAWDVLQNKRVQIVLMDINLPDENGIEMTRRIKSSMPEVAVIVLTILQEKHYQEDAFDAGADGFVLKAEMNSRLLDEIEKVRNSQAL